MKKITAFTIAAIMALGMTACGDTEKKSAGAQQDAKAAAQGENGGSKTSREDMLKTANGNAKKAYNAVAVYFADMETMGKLSEVTEQNAADEAADMLDGYDMGGMIGVTITDLENVRFEVFWRESEDSNIVGRYIDAPRSVEDCPEWDVGAYSYIK